MDTTRDKQPSALPCKLLQAILNEERLFGLVSTDRDEL
ncbi:hypothetical protein EYZ11_010838 [Aspergillus tanneri]|uniref:Uncharacterized protein n=1 Tax=Aspergillus tanneri TaxID=1220188 RepID=A0A4S3J4B1_9EURO|nr:hypothetical protein EYZ11_010838 [Aspergillus tanneri]